MLILEKELTHSDELRYFLFYYYLYIEVREIYGQNCMLMLIRSYFLMNVLF